MSIDNTTIVEFLAANQPDLIKQWHSHIGINALKQLAEEYGEKPAPEPTPKMIDERFVFEFIEQLMFLGDDEGDIYDEEDRKHRLAEFWNSTSQREQAKHLATVWFDMRELREEGFGLMFDYNEFKAEKNAEFKAKGGHDWYTDKHQNVGEWA